MKTSNVEFCGKRKRRMKINLNLKKLLFPPRQSRRMTEAKKYVVYVYTDYRKEIRTRVVRVYDTLG